MRVVRLITAWSVMVQNVSLHCFQCNVFTSWTRNSFRIKEALLIRMIEAGDMWRIFHNNWWCLPNDPFDEIRHYVHMCFMRKGVHRLCSNYLVVALGFLDDYPLKNNWGLLDRSSINGGCYDKAYSQIRTNCRSNSTIHICCQFQSCRPNLCRGAIRS